jgi:ribosomal protein S18 acetylase RimI-like enzyme
MTHSILVREAKPADMVGLTAIIASTDLFPPDMLHDMIAPYFDGNGADDMWLIVEDHDVPVGLAYCAAERMTEGTHNLLLIAVQVEVQGKGYGRALLADLEFRLRQGQKRVLLVETSGLPEFAATRKFYLRNGYTEEARIRDFYQNGEDKIVFWKRLLGS